MNRKRKVKRSISKFLLRNPTGEIIKTLLFSIVSFRKCVFYVCSVFFYNSARRHCLSTSFITRTTWEMPWSWPRWPQRHHSSKIGGGNCSLANVTIGKLYDWPLFVFKNTWQTTTEIMFITHTNVCLSDPEIEWKSWALSSAITFFTNTENEEKKVCLSIYEYEKEGRLVGWLLFFLKAK